MSKSAQRCDVDQLNAMLSRVEVEPDLSLISHIEICASCQMQLQSLAGSNVDWQRTAIALTSDRTNPSNAELDAEWASRRSFGRWDNRSAKWSEALIRPLLDPPSHPELLGRLGRYEIEKLIGYGGMGIVFKAYDSELNRTVAIKILSPHLAASKSARQRFAREASAAAGVVDDHVVPIHNVESDAATPFLVMQYVAGGSLQQRVDREGRLDVAEVLRIGMQTAKGLAAAHAQGLIHRDVKLSNVLLDEGIERAVLTDFGLARVEGDDCLTRPGFHPGTPNYMSPEQVRGQAIDPRSDLFGLGCVLYALCTGHPPFRATTQYAVLRRITDEPASSICEVNPAIPVWLERIVMCLLSKSPEDRYSSAGEVAALLEECLAHVRQPASVPLPQECSFAPVRRLRNRVGMVTGGALLLVVIAHSVSVLKSSTDEPAASAITTLPGDGGLVENDDVPTKHFAMNRPG